MSSLSPHRAAALAIAAALALSPVVASAQWAVFDAANFGRNALTAARTAAQYAQQLKDYELQILQWQTQMQNLQQVPSQFWTTELGHSVLGQSGGCTALNCVIQASDSLDNVYQETNQTDTEAEDLFSQAGAFGEKLNQFAQASGLTPQQVMAQSAARAQAGQDAATSMYEQAKSLDSQLGAWQQQANKNLQAAQNAPGATAAIQATALQAHLETTQLSTLVASATTEQQATALHLESEARQKKRDAAAQARAEQLQAGFEQFVGGGAQ